MAQPPRITTSRLPEQAYPPTPGSVVSGRVFITNALEQIAASKEAKRNKALKEAVGNALEHIKSQDDSPERARIIFRPLRLACETRSEALMNIAVDCIGKLISYGYIIGDDEVEEVPANSAGAANGSKQSDEAKKGDISATKKITRPLLDHAVDVVCDCFVGENTDEKVQLQIIKALSAAVSSTIVTVHQSALLKAVRTTYNIFLLSRNSANQVVAQGTLTQMVHQVFGRVPVPQPGSSASTQDLPSQAEDSEKQSLKSQTPEDRELKAEEKKDAVETPANSVEQDTNEQADMKEPEENNLEVSPSINTIIEEPLNGHNQALTESSVEAVEEAIDKDDNVEATNGAENGTNGKTIEIPSQELQVVATEIAAETSETTSAVEIAETDPQSSQAPEEKDEAKQDDKGPESIPPKEAIDQDMKVEEVSNADQGEVSPENSSIIVEKSSIEATSDEVISEVAKQELEDNKISLKTFEERKSLDLVSTERTDSPRESPKTLFAKDAFLVFRSLCKLSMKNLYGDSETDLKSYSMRSKLLSLHLIHTILSSYMHLFSSTSVIITSSSESSRGTPFIEAVKQYLCLSLSRNAVSLVPQVFETSLEIFSLVIQELRKFLKKEIAVFFNEIFLPILESRTASSQQQRHSLLKAILKICEDPQTLVELYLNYDCEESLDNIYERLVNAMSKITTTHIVLTEKEKEKEREREREREREKEKERDASVSLPGGSASGSSTNLSIFSSSNQAHFHMPPTLSTTSMNAANTSGAEPNELVLKHRSLESLVAVLRSLVLWCNKIGEESAAGANACMEAEARNSEEILNGGVAQPPEVSSSTNSNNYSSNSSAPNLRPSPNSSSTSVAVDDPEQFGNLKHRKQLLRESIKRFNWKPKKGIEQLLEVGLIQSDSPKDIAKFLLYTEGLNKAMIGEYLGEGEPKNIAIMHAFVDQMNFINMKFTAALRHFLQAFRLPGEAQKIDRFMLKFAERYVDGNPDAFANADTAYVLAYSVIMLNTDLHSPQIKRRMTKAEFIKNNRGINDNADLPEEFLSGIYDEINENEIKMKDEQDMIPSGTSNFNVALLGRDARREALQIASEEMASKTEALFKSMLRSRSRKGGQRSNTSAVTFYSASHAEHVRPMFEVAWMAFLAGLSGPLQESEDMEVIGLCLEGFRHAIRVICLFDMELERNAFVTTLAKFTFLNNLGEMKTKNVEAIKTLLDIALTESNYLKGSWREVLTCVSQLERFQLISNGVDQDSVPDLLNARRVPTKSSSFEAASGRKSIQATRKVSGKHGSTIAFDEEVVVESKSLQLVMTVDRIFTSTTQLSGEAIVDFVRSLSAVSWEEIQSSAMAEHPRMFSLQKLVEISYYNMNRIRMEWSNIWAILGEHFNQVGCSSNFNIAFFALDSLRQLSIKFLEKEELTHFKFQKDFLKPFEYIMVNNPDTSIKDMILRCLQQMIQSRGYRLKSGWQTMVSVFAKAAREPTETIVSMSFDIVKGLFKDRFQEVISTGVYDDFIRCLSEFGKNKRFQKISLHSIEMIRQMITRLSDLSESQLNALLTPPDADNSKNDPPKVKFWFPILFGFKEVIMNAEDLEVRTRALTYLFDTLKEYGYTYSRDFWDIICRQAVFPIFDDIRSGGVGRFSSHEDMSVWLSTTLIQALRNLIDLYTYYYSRLEMMTEQVLDLLSACILQDNDTLSRIGCTCLQQLVESNVEKLDDDAWQQICTTFGYLLDSTAPHELFDVEKSSRIEGAVQSSTIPKAEATPEGADEQASAEAPSLHSPTASNHTTLTSFSPTANDQASDGRRRVFQQIVVKCVLQLLLVQTLYDLLNNPTVVEAAPVDRLLELAESVRQSYLFARSFNENVNLRTNLWKLGFMKSLPNLLKQETLSASCYVNLMLNIYTSSTPGRSEKKELVEANLMPLCQHILSEFQAFDPEMKSRNIVAWTPVILSILQSLTKFGEKDFKKNLPNLYPLLVGLLTLDLDKSVRLALKDVLLQVGASFVTQKV
ncbi:uncharacterized protein VTP21DRAFT_3740 [Calcarisporiella thermophila]|uniref:uncharacterized protein n=1 Tax=Calcarisporiella thermophila TaxID=911321 RepID=UPI003743D9B6